MYRVIALILLAYAICFPPLAKRAEAELEAVQRAPTRAELILADLQAFVGYPFDILFAALAKPRDPGPG